MPARRPVAGGASAPTHPCKGVRRAQAARRAAAARLRSSATRSCRPPWPSLRGADCGHPRARPGAHPAVVASHVAQQRQRLRGQDARVRVGGARAHQEALGDLRHVAGGCGGNSAGGDAHGPRSRMVQCATHALAAAGCCAVVDVGDVKRRRVAIAPAVAACSSMAHLQHAGRAAVGIANGGRGLPRARTAAGRNVQVGGAGAAAAAGSSVALQKQCRAQPFGAYFAACTTRGPVHPARPTCQSLQTTWCGHQRAAEQRGAGSGVRQCPP